MTTPLSLPGQWTRYAPKRVWRAFILIIISASTWYYLSLLYGKNGPSTVSDVGRMCEMYPDSGDIVVAIKTGATEAKKKLPAILETSLRCVRDPLVFSDLNQTYGDLKIYDVLSRFSPAVMEHNKDFDIYRDQLSLQREGDEGAIESLAERPAHVFHWHTFGHTAPWALDKYKFIHMLEMAYELQPGKDWYLFIEPDTYLAWPNLKRWLRTLDPTQKLYLGNAIQKSDDREPLYFAHGGSGFILSGPALKEFAVDRKGIAASLDARMHEWWAGDFTVADALYDHLGLKVTTAAPMFTAHHTLSFPFSERAWCEPVITLHHMQAEDFAEISQLEESLKFSRLLLRDVYATVYPTDFPNEVFDWDNVADAKETALDGSAKFPVGDSQRLLDPNTNLDTCRAACVHNEKCFQYTWRNTTIDVMGQGFDSQHSCVLSSAFRLGGHKAPQDFWANIGEKDTYRAWHSGWLSNRIADWVRSNWECPSGDHWVTDGRLRVPA